MRGRSDRSLIKIYKDLMVTKRELIDLRESISQTIRSIKQSDQLPKKRDHPQSCSICDLQLNPGISH